MKEMSKLPFPTRRIQGRTREHPEGINDKLQKNDAFVILCHYTGVCDIAEHVCPKDI
jgi:hypothetical protein